MKTRDDIKSLIQSFSGSANTIAIPRIYLDFFEGDYPVAVIASQLIYWQGKQTREDGYIYKTYADWQDETALSKYQVHRAVNKLGSLVRTKVMKAEGNPTVHYFFDTDEFADRLVKFINYRKLSFFTNQSVVSSLSITENTTENTTETTKKRDNGAKAIAFGAVRLYLQEYREKTGEEHPGLKKAQMVRVIQEISDTCDSLGLGVEEIETIVRAHFRRNFDTDWNVNHFATGRVIELLAYTHCLYEKEAAALVKR